jgi:hypothetical protein
LLVAGCWLLVTNYWLLTTGYWLLNHHKNTTEIAK